jgi:hypothetical protein
MGAVWRGDRAVEGARLEIVCARKGTAGSNPALSAGSLRVVSRPMSQFGSLPMAAGASVRVVVPPTKTR